MSGEMRVPWPRLSRAQWLFAAAVLFWLALIAAFVWLRLPLPPERILNIDERIPVAISIAMSESGHLDPNWALADMRPIFKYDQYNFYLYNVLGHFVQQAGALAGMAPLDALRIMNLACQLGALTCLVLALRRTRADSAWLVAAALLFCTGPTMVHDALMARPESLLYLLTAAGFALALAPWGLLARAGAIGVVCGLGAAVKLTFPVVAISAALALLFLARPSMRVLLGAALAFVLGAAAGFALGAPLAIVNWEVTLNGLAALLRQYDRFFGPHSLIEPTFLAQFAWIVRFFAELYWPCLLFIALGLLVGGARERLTIAILCAPFLFLVVYFATKIVFFERNFAHAAPLLLLAGGAGVAAVLRRLPWRAARVLILGSIALPGLYWSTQIAHAARWGSEEARAFEQRQSLATFAAVSFRDSLAGNPPPTCGSIAVPHFSDERSARYVDMVRDAGFEEVARHSSPFSSLAPSTLQIYIDYNRFYFRKACGAPMAEVSAALGDSWSIDGQHYSVGGAPAGGAIWASHYPLGDPGVGTGRVRFAVPRDAVALALPVVTGPDASGQRLRILAPNGELVAEIPIATGYEQAWRITRVQAPAGGFPGEIVVEGVDEGVAWGQWMGFGAPHAEFSSDTSAEPES